MQQLAHVSISSLVIDTDVKAALRFDLAIYHFSDPGIEWFL